MKVFYFVFERYGRDQRFIDKIVVTKTYNGMLKTAYNRYQRGRTGDNCRFLRAFVGLVYHKWTVSCYRDLLSYFK